MAIAPPSDLVLDVLKAADPFAHRQAAQRLANLSPAGGPLAFADAMGVASDAVGAGGDGYFSALTSLDRESGPAAAGRLDRGIAAVREAGLSPAQKFEAMVLHQFVEAMLPDDAAEVFGEGSTGEIWKSMLAEQVGNQIAASGGIGLAGLLSDNLKETSGA